MDVPRFGWRDGLLLLIVLAAAAGARFWYLYDWCDQAMAVPIQVQAEPPPDVKELSADTSPGYPRLVSLTAKFLDDWQPPVRWAQGGLGALTAGLYFLFARRAFRSVLVGLLAGLCGALWPFWIVNTAELNDGVLATFLLALSLYLGMRASQAGGPATSLVYGLALAGLALVRAALLPFAAAALLWFLLRCRRVPRGWFYALLAFLGFVNGLVPWTLRNLRAHNDVFPIVRTAYYHLWIGNHPGADGGPLEGLAGQPAAEDVKKKGEQDHYRGLAHNVVKNFKDDPAGFVQRRISAGLFFVFGADWFRHDHPICRGDQEYAGILEGCLLGMLLLSVLGWRWTYAWWPLSLPASLALVWIPLPYLLGHADALSGPRLPLDGVLLCYSAFVLACLVPPVRRRLWTGPGRVGPDRAV